MRICPVSGSNRWQPFYKSLSGKIMTGDQRIRNGDLKKIICSDSGVVANESCFTEDEIRLLYGEEYELNTLGKEEHFFYTALGPIARSQVFFDWIEPHLPDSFNTLLEIGCGEGNLLARFLSKFPEKNILGLDGSIKASQLAQAKGLNVKQCVINGEDQVPKTDVLLLINVIEHIEDIPLLISSLKQSLTEGGRIIFCLPIHDYGGYDIFFAEHVWHFTSEHFKIILKKNGLKILHSDTNHAINHGIGLFICEKTNIKFSDAKVMFSDTILKNLLFWRDNFNNLNSYISSNIFKRIAIFGAGELATLFLTFTNLENCKIIACIDDTKMAGEQKHDIPIYGSQWLMDNNVDCLMLAVNKKYHATLNAKFKNNKIKIHPAY